MIHIVCDLKNASQDLLAVADTFRDFRELLPGGDDGDEEEEEPKDSRPARKSGGGASANREYWYEALGEAAGIMMEEGKSPNPGTVKIRLRMLNPNFNKGGTPRPEMGFWTFSSAIRIIASHARRFFGRARPPTSLVTMTMRAKN